MSTDHWTFTNYAVIAALIVSALIIHWVIFGWRWLDRFMITMVYSQEDVARAISKFAAANKADVEDYVAKVRKLEELKEEYEKWFGVAFKDVERVINLEKSLEARKARVAKRRSIQVKLGRVC